MSDLKEIPIFLRNIESMADIRAVEDLQIEAWGDDDRDIVPLNQLVAARHVGGSLIGAFDDERLVGFVYGFYGHVRSRLVHHSHMLAVHPEYRNHNLGFRLKLEQREHVLADRITNRMTWTFDPLQSLNAYFNFAKLGVISDTYKVDVYGNQGASFLHQNGTDRLFVTWLLDSQRVKERISGERSDVDAVSKEVILPIILSSDTNEPVRESVSEVSRAEFVSIEIPADINSIERSDFDLARRWREETRSAFTDAIANGFVVVDHFHKGQSTGSYLLRKARLDVYDQAIV